MFASPIPLQGFAPADPLHASVHIRVGPVPSALRTAIAKRNSWQANRNEVLVVDRQVSRIHIARRGVVTVDPISTAGNTDERLQGIPIAAALGFARSLVLHGAAAEVGGEAVLLVGRNGVGKSTTAAALSGLVGRSVCDNLAVIDVSSSNDEVLLQRGPSTIKLWNDSAGMLDVDVSQLRRVSPNVDKFVVDIDRADFGSLPIAAVVAMDQTTDEQPTLVRLAGANAVEAVRQNQFRRRILEAILPNAIEMAEAIAKRVPVYELRRPSTDWPPDRLANWLRVALADVRAGASELGRLPG